MRTFITIVVLMWFCLSAPFARAQPSAETEALVVNQFELHLEGADNPECFVDHYDSILVEHVICEVNGEEFFFQNYFVWKNDVLDIYFNPEDHLDDGKPYTEEEMEEMFRTAAAYWTNVTSSRFLVRYAGLTDEECDNVFRPNTFLFCLTDGNSSSQAGVNGGFTTWLKTRKWAISSRGIASSIGGALGLDYYSGSEDEFGMQIESIMASGLHYEFNEHTVYPKDVKVLRLIFPEPVLEYGDIIKNPCVWYGAKQFSIELQTIEDEDGDPIAFRLTKAKRNNPPQA
jgi:hypothetical protein